MKTTVQKWGNSLALRIPSAFAKEVQVRQGSEVDLTVVEGRLIATPAKKRKPSLAQMLKLVTKENRPSEIDWGAPVGREVW